MKGEVIVIRTGVLDVVGHPTLVFGVHGEDSPLGFSVGAQECDEKGRLCSSRIGSPLTGKSDFESLFSHTSSQCQSGDDCFCRLSSFREKD